MRSSSFREGCLTNYVALITGGGSGICKGIALKFLEAGASIAILSRDIEKLKEAAKELLSKVPGSQCLPIAADVRKYDAMSDAIDYIIKEFGRIDILINGAAGNFLCAPEQLSYNAFKSVMEIDAHGTFITSQLVHNKAFGNQAPLINSRNQRGLIINISMTLHYTGTLMQTHAGMAKAAIDAMTQHLAVEWGPEDVRVVGIAPGPIEGTVGVSRLSDLSSNNNSSVTRFGDIVPLQRLGTIDDISNVCLFLCLPEASYITGTTIVVDGGQWLASSNYALFYPQIREAWANKGNQLPRQQSKM